MIHNTWLCRIDILFNMTWSLSSWILYIFVAICWLLPNFLSQNKSVSLGCEFDLYVLLINICRRLLDAARKFFSWPWTIISDITTIDQIWSPMFILTKDKLYQKYKKSKEKKVSGFECKQIIQICWNNNPPIINVYSRDLHFVSPQKYDKKFISTVKKYTHGC